MPPIEIARVERWLLEAPRHAVGAGSSQVGLENSHLLTVDGGFLYWVTAGAITRSPVGNSAVACARSRLRKREGEAIARAALLAGVAG